MDSESLFLTLAMAVVNKYGGTVKFNTESNVMMIDVAKEHKVTVAEEIANLASSMGIEEGVDIRQEIEDIITKHGGTVTEASNGRFEYSIEPHSKEECMAEMKARIRHYIDTGE